MATDEEGKARIEELEAVSRERLHELELQARIRGFSTPPEVRIEIAKIKRELGIFESVVNHPVDVQTLEDLGAGGRWLATDKKLDQIAKFLSERMDRMEENADERYRQQEDARRDATASWRSLFILLSIGLFLALVIEAFLIGGLFR